MNPELEIQDGIYEDLSLLLAKANTIEHANAFFASYLQAKIAAGIIDMYDYEIKDMGIHGLQAFVEFNFAWNIVNTCNMQILPKITLAKRFDRAMGVV
ncbi:MAG: hypothetical protein KGI25_08705 [Thaumarchaeota archaeon]|nr:hypothetical protein [Nitrososphaerota archaeon]